MNGNSPEVQAAYDELTAVIEKLERLNFPGTAPRSVLGEYLVVGRITELHDDGCTQDANVILTRDNAVPLSQRLGLAQYAVIRFGAQSAAACEHGED